MHSTVDFYACMRKQLLLKHQMQFVLVLLQKQEWNVGISREWA